MKKIFVILIVCSSTQLYSQNLVPNPSFEDVYSYPTGVSQFYRVKNWFEPITSHTADLLHALASNSSAGVPNNGFGFQNARTGDAYANIYTYLYDTIYGFNNNTREYISIELTDTLATGRCYNVIFYFAVSDLHSKLIVKNIGVVFSYDSTNTNYTNHIDNTAPIDSFNFDDWYEISINYIANGGEKFITIGNFNDSITSDTLFHPNYPSQTNLIESYIYIDDVSVTLVECTPLGILENKQSKELLGIFDILGRETKSKKNTPLFYMYDDGTVEKRMVVE
jgi:hypothetical protein